MAELLNVEPRTTRGKHEARRLRRRGSIPAILYGHGEANVSLAVSAEQMATLVRHGARVVELRGAVSEKALIRDVQWDTYGTDLVHVDFARVSEHERVHVKVKVELRGQSPGAKQGGVVALLVHEVEIECEALSIPERLELNIRELKLDGTLSAADITLPEGVTLLVDPETVVVQCVKPKEVEEAAPVVLEAVEPELIGRKVEAEEEAEEEK